MDFNKHKPIYLQIADTICEKILSGELEPGGRILSVRELGVNLGVNPNTVARVYEHLQGLGIIYNRRGIGYFVSDDAKSLIIKQQREEFIQRELPLIIKRMKMLEIPLDVLLPE